MPSTTPGARLSTSLGIGLHLSAVCATKSCWCQCFGQCLASVNLPILKLVFAVARIQYATTPCRTSGEPSACPPCLQPESSLPCMYSCTIRGIDRSKADFLRTPEEPTTGSVTIHMTHPKSFDGGALTKAGALCRLGHVGDVEHLKGRLADQLSIRRQ